MKKKNGFLTLVFSCYPGGGHMYLGFMKQGLQLMILFSAILAVSSMAYTFRFTAFLLPVLVAYSVFDAGYKRSNMIEADDSDLDLFRWLNVRGFKGMSRPDHYKMLAYSLIVIGGYILLDNLLIDMISRIIVTLSSNSISISYVKRLIMSSLLGVIFIIGGFKLLGQMRKINGVQEEE